MKQNNSRPCPSTRNCHYTISSVNIVLFCFWTFYFVWLHNPTRQPEKVSSPNLLMRKLRFRELLGFFKSKWLIILNKDHSSFLINEDMLAPVVFSTGVRIRQPFFVCEFITFFSKSQRHNWQNTACSSSLWKNTFLLFSIAAATTIFTNTETKNKIVNF